MADKEKNVVLNFKMDGQVKYAETLREINAVMNTAAKEYKNHIAAMGKDADATDKLAAEKKKLEIQMEAAQKRTKMLRGQYEAMAKDTNTTTGQLTEMYGKLLNAEKAEISLEKALDRVNGGLTDQAQEARKAMGELDDLKGESKLLEAEQKSLTSSFKLQNESLDKNASEAEKTELAQQQLRKQMDLTERTVENLERQLDATKKVYGENSVEVMQMETKINDARTTLKKFSKSLDGVDKSSEDVGDGLQNLGKKMDINNLLEAAEALQGVSDKMIEIGTAAFETSLAIGDSQTNLQANLGLTAKEAEKMNEVVNDVYKHGVVDSMEEANDAVILVKQSFEDLDDVELEKLTNKITTIAKRTNTDVKENVIAAEKMMEQFGITGEESLDLIAAGYEKGLNKNEDFLDTLAEYSPHFEAAGYSADEMMQIINNGMENGALNTNIAADAVKEFQVRLGDGSIKENLDDFSQGTKDMFDKWEDGKATTAEVAEAISKDLEKMSPNEQQQALSVLASQFEDLGIDGARALFDIGEEFDNVNGKADEMSTRNPGEDWKSSLRELKDALVPIGESIQENLTPIVEKLSEMKDVFQKLPEPVQTFIGVFSGLAGVALVLTPIIAGLAAAFVALDIALFPILGTIAFVVGAIAGMIAIFTNLGEITYWLITKWQEFKNWFSETVVSIAHGAITNFTEMKDKVVGKVTELVFGAITKFNELKANVKETAINIVSNFVSKFIELKNKAVGKVNELRDGAVGKFNDLKSKAGNIINSFKDNVFGKVSDLKSKFVGKVNDLKDGAVGKFNQLRDRAGSIMSRTKEKILSPMEKARDKIREIVEKIKGFFTNLKLKIPKPTLPKLPTFSLEWDSKTIMGKNIKYPTGFDIDWYARSSISTKPRKMLLEGGAKEQEYELNSFIGGVIL